MAVEFFFWAAAIFSFVAADGLSERAVEEVFFEDWLYKLESPIVTPQHDLPTTDIITNEGYPVEVHSITTEDCYRLELHRIPTGKENGDLDVFRPAVFLQHGLLSSSADWVIPTPTKSLAFLLADAGYDVWLGNYRGNTYSRGHCNLSADDDFDYWKFSWDQMALYDLPASIDFVIEKTGQDKIHFVGHSMGTTTFMAMINLRPEYADKIIMANLMGPVAYVGHMKSPIKLLAPYVETIENLARLLGIGEFLPGDKFTSILADTFCEPGLLPPLICESVFFFIFGFDPLQVNETLLETIVNHTPAGTSTFTVLHYAQEVNSGGFFRYDLGDFRNNRVYDQPTPPEYDVRAVNVPVSLYWGQGDWLATPNDILSLVSKLPDVFDNYEVPWENWAHLDFIYGIDANTLVYPRVMENMAEAEQAFR